MKTTLLVITLLIISGLTVTAQGVILGPGDTLAFGFNPVDFSRVGSCHTTEFSPGSVVTLAFSGDLLGPGESLRVEMFENDLSETPFATQTYTPASLTPRVMLTGGYSRWLDYQGVIRVSMFTGTVNVDSGHFIVSPNFVGYCETLVPVPEPGTLLLLSAVVVFTGALRLVRIR